MEQDNTVRSSVVPVICESESDIIINILIIFFIIELVEKLCESEVGPKKDIQYIYKTTRVF